MEEIEEYQDDIVEEDTVGSTPNLAVEISTSFPDSEIFGVKLVNGRATRAILDVSNHETAPINVLVVGGSLTTPIDVPGAPDPPVVLRNLTAAKYGVQIPAGEKETLTYSFATEMHPQDLRLSIAAVLQNEAGSVFTKMVYNETVSVVEAPMSIFDPQMYVHTTSTLSSYTSLTDSSASSSTSSSSLPSAAPATSSTTPGSQPSSHRRSAAARVESVRRSLLAAAKRSIQQIKHQSLVLTDRPSQAVPKPTTKAGSQHHICRGRRRGESGAEDPRVVLLRKTATC